MWIIVSNCGANLQKNPHCSPKREKALLKKFCAHKIFFLSAKNFRAVRIEFFRYAHSVATICFGFQKAKHIFRAASNALQTADFTPWENAAKSGMPPFATHRLRYSVLPW
jgi:hypothetical protein